MLIGSNLISPRRFLCPVRTQSPSTIMPAMRYRDANAAIEWLCNVFGFERHAVYPGPNNTVGHAELTLGGGMIMLGSGKDDEYGRASNHHRNLATKKLAAFTSLCPMPMRSTPAPRLPAARLSVNFKTPITGSREFWVKDPEGHCWSVGTYNPWKTQG